MIKTAFRLALIAASFAAVQAHATTVNFTGVVTNAYGYNAAVPTAGETITGSFTFDANAPSYYSDTDGVSYAYKYSYDNSGTHQYGISGSAVFSDGTVLRLDSSGGSAYTGQYIYRNYGGYLNEMANYAETFTPGNYAWNVLEVYGYDYNGASSTLFKNPAAGLSFEQDVNVAGLTGYFQGASTTGYYSGNFTPTSFSISAVPESSNLALLLGGLGLVGFAARRRQQASRG